LGLKILYCATHGDDVDLELETVAAGVELLDRLNYYGMNVSLDKTSIHVIDNPATEFLKFITLKESSHGYAGRMVSSLLFEKPW
jgi:hypothetical protein